MLCNCSASVAKESLVYSYGRSFNGFAAKLTSEEATRISGEIITSYSEYIWRTYRFVICHWYLKRECDEIAGMRGVISVFPSRILKLHTTRSWDFMGLTTNKVGGPEEGDVIIGLLDTGKYMKIILGALLRCSILQAY